MFLTIDSYKVNLLKVFLCQCYLSRTNIFKSFFRRKICPLELSEPALFHDLVAWRTHGDKMNCVELFWAISDWMRFATNNFCTP